MKTSFAQEYFHQVYDVPYENLHLASEVLLMPRKWHWSD